MNDAALGGADEQASAADPAVTGQASEDMTRAVRGTALNIVGAVVTTISGFGSVFIVSNRLGQVPTGVLFTGVGLFTFLASAAKVGTEASLTWFVSRARAANDRAAILRVVRSALIAVAFIGIALAAATIALAGPLAALLTDDPANEPDLRRILIVLGVAIPAWAVAQASYGATRGFATMRPSVLYGAIIRPLALVGTLAALVFLSDELWLVAFAWFVAGLTSLVLSMWWLRRRMADFTMAETGNDDDHRAAFWSFTRPRALSDIIHAALERLDLVLLGALAGEAAAGEYAAASRMVLAGQLVMMAISQAMAPQVSAQLARGDHPAAEQMIQRLTTWTVLALWPVAAALAFAGPGLMSLFGAEFTDAAPLLIVLGVGLAVIAAIGPGDTVLLMTGDSRGSLLNHVTALVVMLGVSVATIPSLDSLGVALAWAASRVTLRALSNWRIAKATGIVAMGPLVRRACLVSAATFVPLGLALRLAGVDDLLVLAGLAVVGGGLHLAALFALRERLAIDDLSQILRGGAR